MKWAMSFAINRLFFLAVVVLIMNAYFRTSCGFENSFVDQFNQFSGFDQLYRAFDHRN